MELRSLTDKLWNRKYDFLFNGKILQQEQKYSEHGEEKVLECIFKNKTGYFVDIGAFGQRSSNTWALIEKGWSGLLIDSNLAQFDEMTKLLEDNMKIYVDNSHVTQNNLNSILLKFKVPKEFEFLSIDVDNYEYEIWRNLTNYKPKVVCIEVNTMEPNFKKINYDPSYSVGRSGYGGATIGLMNRLARNKGYDYLCWDVSNAIYLRRGFVKH